MARSTLKAKSLGNEFWVEEVHTLVYTLNRCPTEAVLNLTPEESWSGHKPSVSDMKVFGCIAYAHVPKEKRSKLDDKSVKCIFIGYNIETRSYRSFDPQENKWIISRDVVFDEQGIYQPRNVHIELRKDEAIIGDGSSSKSSKENEVEKKHTWLVRGHSKSISWIETLGEELLDRKDALSIFILLHK